MMLLKISFRNVLRQKRRTLFTVLMMAGGFALASVSIGWSDGTYSYIIDMFTRNRMGHIQIHAAGYLDKPSLYKTIDDYMRIGETVESVPGVESWSPRLYSAGLVSLGEETTAAQLVAVDPQRESIATRFEKKIVDGRTFSTAPAREVILGKGLAKVLDARVGEELVFVSQAADGSIADDSYRIIGILDSGDELSDRASFYLPLQVAQELLVLDDRVHEICVIAEHPKQVRRLAQTLGSALNDPNLEASPWQEFAKQFYLAMQTDQKGTYISLFVILLIVAVGVLNTVLMSVLERRREFGVLKAIGTRPMQIVSMVLFEVSILALVSVLIGIVLGVAGNYYLSIHGMTLSESFTYGGIEFKTMYAEINARSLFIPAITVALASTLVSIFPAANAARMDPARTMRMH